MAGNIGETNAIDSETKVQGVKGDYWTGAIDATLTLDGTYGSVVAPVPSTACDVVLWPVATREGCYAEIVNKASGANTLTVKNVGGSTIASVPQNRKAILFCDGSTWALVHVQIITLT